MNCSALHRELLALERLDPAPADARAHLAGCAACRVWYRKLTAVERLAAQTVLPAPQQKAAFVARFLAMKDEPAEDGVLPFAAMPARRTENPRLLIRERAQRKTALAVALAASLALVALGIWAWQGYEPTRQTGNDGPKTPVVSRLQARLNAEPQWNKATDREKVEILDRIAKELEERTKVLADADQLDAQALAAEVELYCNVIDEIAFKHAQHMPSQERLRVLEPIANRLARVESDASILANRQTDAAAATSLRRLAAKAHEGRDRLLEIL